MLAVKLAAVSEAKAKFQFACIESGAFELSSEQRFLHVTLESLGMHKKGLTICQGGRREHIQNSGICLPEMKGLWNNTVLTQWKL